MRLLPRAGRPTITTQILESSDWAMISAAIVVIVTSSKRKSSIKGKAGKEDWFTRGERKRDVGRKGKRRGHGTRKYGSKISVGFRQHNQRNESSRTTHLDESYLGDEIVVASWYGICGEGSAEDAPRIMEIASTLRLSCAPGRDIDIYSGI